MCVPEDLKLKEPNTDLTVGRRVMTDEQGEGTIVFDRGNSVLVLFDKADAGLHNGSSSGLNLPENRCWYFQKVDSTLKVVGAESAKPLAKAKPVVKHTFTTVVEDVEGDDLITDEAFNEIYVMRNDGTTLNITMTDDVPVIEFYDDSDGFWTDQDGNRLSNATWNPAEDSDEDEE